MALLKQFFPVFAIIILSAAAFADQPAIKIEMRFDKFGNMEFSQPEVVFGTVTQPEEGENSVFLTDFRNEIIYQLNFTTENFFTIYEKEGAEQAVKNLQSNDPVQVKSFYLPLLQDAVSLEVHYNGLATALPLAAMICNNDGSCNNSENVLGCANDCHVLEDRFCTPFEDGICDADCFQGIDRDCEKQPDVPPKVQQFIKPEEFILIALGIIFAFIGISLFIRHRKRSY